ncbi:MAG TPA: DUF4476 domain-containing protein [Chitinophagaceae bacterium]|nr:DUF4476 domain-containing protein [Chitinophagaceae bacterium]
MSKLTACLLFSLASLTGFSQKVYFVYLQSENEQGFYVKMNASVRSSSASGYLILSKLRDTTYNFAVGFPQNKWPEQNFSVSINKKDHGYLLKNFGEKGWGLFDLQTLSVQMAVSGSAKIEEKKMEENKDVSIFTDILSKAADDPSLKEKSAETKIEEKKVETLVQETVSKENPKELAKDTVAIKPVEIIAKSEQPKTEEKKVETIVQENVSKENPKELAKDTVATKPVEIIAKPELVKEEKKVDNQEQPVVKLEEAVTAAEEEYKPTIVRKRSESSTTEGFGLVFIDDLRNGTNDTIRLLIPNPKSIATITKEEPREEKKFIEILPDTVKKKEETEPDIKPVVTENPVEKNVFKNNCPAVAEESDFFKLRKNMAAAEGDDGMLLEAKNYFKTKCFSTGQVKNLGSMFLNDAGKYKFFDLAYSYVTDIDKFSVLQNELKEQEYINRFKAMLRN